MDRVTARRNVVVNDQAGPWFYFRTREVSRLCSVNDGMLRRMIQDGTIRPTIRAGRGGGKSNQFSPQLTLGVAIACGLIFSKRGCSQAYAQDVVEAHASMSNDTLQACIAEQEDGWDEERLAAWQGEHGIFHGPHTPVDELARQAFEEILRRVEAVLTAIRRRLE
jgi:hypothetical protein